MILYHPTVIHGRYLYICINTIHVLILVWHCMERGDLRHFYLCHQPKKPAYIETSGLRTKLKRFTPKPILRNWTKISFQINIMVWWTHVSLTIILLLENFQINRWIRPPQWNFYCVNIDIESRLQFSHL